MIGLPTASLALVVAREKSKNNGRTSLKSAGAALGRKGEAFGCQPKTFENGISRHQRQQNILIINESIRSVDNINRKSTSFSAASFPRSSYLREHSREARCGAPLVGAENEAAHSEGHGVRQNAYCRFAFWSLTCDSVSIA